MSNGMIFIIALLDTLELGRITKQGRKCRFLHAWCVVVWDSGLHQQDDMSLDVLGLALLAHPSRSSGFQLCLAPEDSRRLAAIYLSMLGPVILVWHIEPD